MNSHLQTSLSEEQVLQNKSQYGENQIKQAKPKKWYHYFFS